jgi:DNA-binding transcriptional LysR family regulator
MLDTDQLRSFLAIIDAGSFTRAAERVAKTQSAVSMQMKRLEERLGRPLFMKDGRGVRLSSDGETLAPYAREMLRIEAAALAAVSGEALAGRVALGMPDDFADWLMADVAKDFSRRHPLVELSLVCDNSVSLAARVAARELDLAVVTLSPEVEERAKSVEVIATQPLKWVASRRHGAQERRPLPLALDGPACPWRQAAVAALAAADVSWRLVLASRSRAAILPLVESGLAVTVLPPGSIRGDLRALDGAFGLPSLPDARVALTVAATPSHEARALAQSIREVARASMTGRAEAA